VACALVLGLAVVLQAGALHAQTSAPAEPLRLKRSEMLQERLDPQGRKSLPVFVSGERLSGRSGQETVVEGNAQLRRGSTLIRADRLEYRQVESLALASGNVRINREGSVFEGTSLELNVETFAGSMQAPRYQFLSNQAQGEADRVDFIDHKRAVIHNATYSTCTRHPGPSWMPEWILRAASIRIDTESNEGVAEGALLSFKGFPLLPIPALSFPLTDERKSGFLPPALGFDNQSGLDLSVPYYWNIAPNRDATFFPAFMSKRGVDLGGEFRYLESTYHGTLRANLMPNDRLRDRTRWGVAFNHSATLDAPFMDGSQLRANVGLNRVSDDNYWRDFPRATSSLTQRLLASNGSLDWSEGPYSLSLRALKWQTLQDASAPITPPYDRMPQLLARYQPSTIGGYDFSLSADQTRFVADPALTLQPNALRTFALAQASRTWGSPGWFITPKAQLHVTNYQFDAPLANGARSAGRVAPTFSLDAGMVFERDASYFGRAFKQTLEPRAFFVNTPFRDQGMLPNYDSAANDFNFATIYTENAFGGHDRISDSRLLTLGLSSRLIDPDTGVEAVRVGAAQRVRFKDQNVTLPGGVPVADRISDLLLGASINWDPKWSLDTTLQYNAKTGTSERFTVGARYSPGDYRTVSAAYRLQRNASEQIDVGWQWPLNDLWGDKGSELGRGQGQGEGRWYSVGRVNFSLRDRRLVDSLLGFEYDAGCWIGRIVLERLQNSSSSVNKRVLFQLEFVGFSRFGPSPLARLRESIPRYQNLREQTTTPSRFGNYE
jgi:LPS-assembly protein